MRVGLFLPNIPKTRGGGYTFENEIHDSILKYGGDTNHSFIYFGWGKSKLDEKLNHIEYIDLTRPWIDRVITGIKHRFYSLMGLKKQERALWMTDYLTKKMVENNISVIWYPTQSVNFTNWPYIATVWDLQHRIQPYFPEVSLNGEWEKREDNFRKVLHKAAFIITGAEAGKKEIMNYYNISEDRIWKIPHPTPAFCIAKSTEVKSDIVLKKFGISKPYLFYPAQFWAHKNHVTLLKVLAVLKKKGIDIQLVFCGSDKGNKNHILNIINKLGLEEDVKLLGFIDKSELKVLYGEAEALVYASTFGPENLPPLEAMALDCPVIATNVPGAEEQIGKYGKLVSPYSIDEWVEAITQTIAENNNNFNKQIINEANNYSQTNSGGLFVKKFSNLLDEFTKVRDLWD